MHWQAYQLLPSSMPAGSDIWIRQWLFVSGVHGCAVGSHLSRWLQLRRLRHHNKVKGDSRVQEAEHESEAAPLHLHLLQRLQRVPPPPSLTHIVYAAILGCSSCFLSVSVVFDLVTFAVHEEQNREQDAHATDLGSPDFVAAGNPQLWDANWETSVRDACGVSERHGLFEDPVLRHCLVHRVLVWFIRFVKGQCNNCG